MTHIFFMKSVIKKLVFYNLSFPSSDLGVDPRQTVVWPPIRKWRINLIWRRYRVNLLIVSRPRLTANVGRVGDFAFLLWANLGV